MPLVEFSQIIDAADEGEYAVGYFESWNLESLLAVADAAEAVRSPVILGFSGIYLPHPDRQVADPLAAYTAMARAVGEALSVPCCLLFNESPNLDWVLAAIDLGFHLVMLSRDDWRPQDQIEAIRRVVERAHAAGCAVEGEPAPLAGVAGGITCDVEDRRLTDLAAARRFVEQTGVDALAVNVGQVHLHGRRTVNLDLELLRDLREGISVPLVLHGASSVARDDLRRAVELGVRKINVGSVLKQAFFNEMCRACGEYRRHANPYEVIGSGLDRDVLVAGRTAMRQTVEEFMRCFGSANKAGSTT